MPETSEYIRLGDGANQSLFGRWQYLTRLEKGLIIITTVFGIVIFSLAVALAQCDSQVPPNVTTISPETTTAPNSTTTAPNSTTVEPSSTSAAPTSTTVEPSSTSIAPTSTTVKPSSTSVAPTSTAVEPSSFTILPSSTTVEPSSTSVASTSTTVEPSPTTILPSSSIKDGNAKQFNTKSTTASDKISKYSLPIPENVSELLQNIPPIPITGIKLMSTQNDETLKSENLAESNAVTTEASAQKETEVMGNFTKNINDNTSKHPVIIRKKRT